MARKTSTRKTAARSAQPRRNSDTRPASPRRSSYTKPDAALLPPEEAARLPGAILITGAGAGIGRALALELAGRGRRVYAGVRDLARAERDFTGAPESLQILRLDVNRDHEARAGLARIHADGFRAAALVNNAGYGLYGAFEELPEDRMRAQFETNFFAPQRLCRLVLPEMRAAGEGRILNVSSILGQLSIPLGSGYCSSKWALEGWSEALRFEVAPFGVQVSLAEPGLIRTNFKANMDLPTAPEPGEELLGRDGGATRKTPAPPPPSDRSGASPYAGFAALLQRDYSGFTSSAEAAARRIAGVLERGRMPARFRVGLDARGYYWLRRLGPQGLLDWIIRRVVASRLRSGTAGH